MNKIILLKEREDLDRFNLRVKFPEVMDSSMLKDFIDCPTLFYYRHVLGLSRKGGAKAHLDWGTRWHLLHETFDLTGSFAEALAKLDPWPATLRVDPSNRTRDRMALLFTEYVNRYHKQDAEDFTLIQPEQFFHVFHEGLGIEWSGRMDRVVERKRTGKMIGWDYKTTSRMGADFWDSYEFSFQLPGYVWALNQLSPDASNEIMIDVLYTLKGSAEFFRRTVRYTEDQLDEWAYTVRKYLDRLYYLRDNHLYEPKEWVKNWNHCTRWGRCAFADVCHIPDRSDTRLRILSEYYEEDRWDPSDPR